MLLSNKLGVDLHHECLLLGHQDRHNGVKLLVEVEENIEDDFFIFNWLAGKDHFISKRSTFGDVFYDGPVAFSSNWLAQFLC